MCWPGCEQHCSARGCPNQRRDRKYVQTRRSVGVVFKHRGVAHQKARCRAWCGSDAVPGLVRAPPVCGLNNMVVVPIVCPRPFVPVLCPNPGPKGAGPKPEAGRKPRPGTGSVPVPWPGSRFPVPGSPGSGSGSGSPVPVPGFGAQVPGPGPRSGFFPPPVPFGPPGPLPGQCVRCPPSPNPGP